MCVVCYAAREWVASALVGELIKWLYEMHGATMKIDNS